PQRRRPVRPGTGRRDPGGGPAAGPRRRGRRPRDPAGRRLLRPDGEPGVPDLGPRDVRPGARERARPGGRVVARRVVRRRGGDRAEGLHERRAALRGQTGAMTDERRFGGQTQVAPLRRVLVRSPETVDLGRWRAYGWLAEPDAVLAAKQHD